MTCPLGLKLQPWKFEACVDFSAIKTSEKKHDQAIFEVQGHWQQMQDKLPLIWLETAWNFTINAFCLKLVLSGINKNVFKLSSCKISFLVMNQSGGRLYFDHHLHRNKNKRRSPVDGPEPMLGPITSGTLQHYSTVRGLTMLWHWVPQSHTLGLPCFGPAEECTQNLMALWSKVQPL